MATESASEQSPSTTAILGGAVNAIWESPIIIVVFLVSGVLGVVVPSIFDSIVTIIATSIGVVIAYQALGGRMGSDSSFLFRLFKACIAMFLLIAPLIIGIFALFLTAPTQLVFLGGFFALLLLWLYILRRLLLSVPAAG